MTGHRSEHVIHKYSALLGFLAMPNWQTTTHRECPGYRCVYICDVCCYYEASIKLLHCARHMPLLEHTLCRASILYSMAWKSTSHRSSFIINQGRCMMHIVLLLHNKYLLMDVQDKRVHCIMLAVFAQHSFEPRLVELTRYACILLQSPGLHRHPGPLLLLRVSSQLPEGLREPPQPQRSAVV